MVRAAPERSVGSGGAGYTMTGSRCIGWKVFPRLTTRGSTLSATPRSTQYHVIFAMINRFVEPCNQFGLTALVHAALEDGELYPGSVSVHQLVDLAPPLRVGNVVGDDVQVLVHGFSAS